MSEKMGRPGAEKASRVNAESCEIFYSYAEPNMQNEREMRCFALFPITGKEIDDRFHFG